jgi:F420-non-reducing hydrogenase iron-sulfur subunit
MSDLEFRPKMVGIICNWCCYGGADLCGVSRFQYPPFIRLVRVMCSGRVDFTHIFRAFSNGMDAVFVGGCHINDCHYVTEGNYDALAMVAMCKRLLAHIGVNPARLRLEWVSAGEGIRFANIMNEYGAQVQKLGPLGKGEGLEPKELKARLAAVTRIIPHMKLVLSERMVPTKRTEQAYHAFFSGAEFERLFRTAVLDKLELSRILRLLAEGPRTTGELSRTLGLSASEVSRHVRTSAKRGLLKYDAGCGSYSLA